MSGYNNPSRPSADWFCSAGVRNCPSCIPPDALSQEMKEGFIYQTSAELGKIRVTNKNGQVYLMGKNGEPSKPLEHHKIPLMGKLTPIGMIRAKAKANREQVRI